MTHRKLCTLIFTVCFTICPFVLVHADVLTIPDLNQNAQTRPSIAVPTRGTTMQDVSAQFGQPDEILGPVGDPPITRWVYDQFTVHFEHEYVIHSVIKRDINP